MSWKTEIFSNWCPGRRYSPTHVLEEDIPQPMSWKGDILHLMSWKEKIFSSSCPGRRYSPAHVLEGLRVWRAKQCLECLEAKACRGGEVLGQRGKYVSSKILPKFVMTNNSQISAPSWFQSNIYIFNEASPSLFWFGSAQLSFYSSLPISLSLAACFCLCRECGTLFAGREFLPENLWVKEGMGATAGEE